MRKLTVLLFTMKLIISTDDVIYFDDVPINQKYVE